jgi:hypothetical protein
MLGGRQHQRMRHRAPTEKTAPRGPFFLGVAVYPPRCYQNQTRNHRQCRRTGSGSFGGARPWRAATAGTSMAVFGVMSGECAGAVVPEGGCAH